MKFPENRIKGVNNTGLVGIALMLCHITGYLNHWTWALLYVPLILSAIGQEYLHRD